MKTRELMIGNLVIVREQIRAVTTLSTGKTPICTHIKGCKFSEIHFSESDVEPIPLTEEWLTEKLGLQKIREYFTIDDFEIQKDKKGYYAHINSGNLYIRSVHQLQNLFFCLNGHELTIKDL